VTVSFSTITKNSARSSPVLFQKLKIFNVHLKKSCHVVAGVERVIFHVSSLLPHFFNGAFYFLTGKSGQNKFEAH